MDAKLDQNQNFRCWGDILSLVPFPLIPPVGAMDDGGDEEDIVLGDKEDDEQDEHDAENRAY